MEDTEIITHGATGVRIAETLRDAILAGDYAPGERIRQDELAEQHGASRLPVRDALRILKAEGLVTLVANAGAWVSTISLAECQEMYRMRERLEPLLLGLNIPFLSDAQIAHLAHLADEMEATTDVERFLVLDRDFHMNCLEAAETTVLGDAVRSLWNRTQHYRREATRLFYDDGDRSVHYDHQLLVGAIRRRDVEEAERVLAGHIRRSRLQLAEHPGIFAGH
ncbi:GntR family transcriptional regulator [Arthrobacter sp. MI7-26]|uniref:GntR family transcriptional regulator n=1 Tax=Arthrobacter sp. MI7-26 TaxID=2993653 RepID=UPI002249084F|nr:GntR family transcriptional regulator [Arthrobacter sp. MI7-26]MCX2750018.1 GntR family transcriptional regulator [Arthrobacter sp. MI7-26]